MKQRILFALAFLLMAGTAQAAPFIEPALLRMIQSPTESNRVVTVFLSHRDRMPFRGDARRPRAAQQREMMRNADASQAETLRLIQQGGRVESRLQVKRFWLTNTIVVTGPIQSIAPLLRSPGVAAARLNRTVRLITPQHHGLVRPRGEPFTYGLNKLRIPEVLTTRGDLDGRGVVVGILDTGIDASHPDLQGKTILFKDFVANRKDPYDDHSHGTHVAGTIAGGRTSGTAIGVAPGAKLIIGKIFDRNGSATDDKIMEALQWMADPDGNPDTNDAPRLVSNSWGGGRPSGDPKNSEECKALDAWVGLGILPVFAAGNSGPGPRSVDMPGACPSALTVGATDENDAIARFSSRGPAVWSTGAVIKPVVSAPGVRVTSAVPGGKYSAMSGTSMATPHVAGLAALLIQARPQDDVTSLSRLLIAGSVDLGTPGQDDTFGWGRVDAVQSLKAGFRRP